MKGISPVISAILLMLLVVSAAGGMWVWYQRQSATLSGSAEERISEQVDQQAMSSLSLAGSYLSGGKLVLIINNAGSSALTIDGYRVDVGSTTSFNSSVSLSIPSRSTATLATTVSCSSGQTAKIQLFSKGIASSRFIETC